MYVLMIDNARLETRKSSNGRKIARMAQILTIFGPKRSQRPKLSHEKIFNEGNERKVPEKFENLSKIVPKISQNRYWLYIFIISFQEGQ